MYEINKRSGETKYKLYQKTKNSLGLRERTITRVFNITKQFWTEDEANSGS